MENFVTSADPSCWSAVYKLYDKVLKLKAEKLKPDKRKQLLELDWWYQEDLPEAIQSRKERHITHEELCKLMKWKLTRGKFRPRLEQLVETNSEELVESASKKAFKKLPNVSAAITALIELKAVGPATASAVLAAGAPELAAFMADESMLMLPGLQPLAYTLNFYLQYMDQVKSLVKKLNKGEQQDWTPHKVEITLWTYHLAKQLQPDLLSKLASFFEIKRKAVDADENQNKKKIKT